MARQNFLTRLNKAEFWFARGQNLYTLLTVPTVTAAITAVSGYMGNIPVMWIIMVSAITFAAVAHGMLRLNEWRTRTAVEYQFDLLNIFHRQDCTWDKNGKPTKVEKINIGVQVANRAPFPMQYRFNAFRVHVAGRMANDQLLINKTFTIPSNAGAHVHPDAINVADLKTLDLKGTIEVEVAYGTGDNLKYEIEKKWEFDFVVNRQTSTKPNAAVGFAPRELT